MLFVVLIAVVIALVVATLLIANASQPNREQRYAQAEHSAPAELRTATRLNVGGTLSMTKPFALHGKTDHIYMLADGRLVVREDKSSFHHIEAAIIQASVYAAILRHSPPDSLRGYPVANYAWIRQGRPEKGRVRYVRAQLLSDDILRGLVDTYVALGNGWKPHRTRDPKTCRFRCSFHNTRCSGAGRG